METRQIDFYTPVESPLPEPGNPALREDPTVPVAEADWPRLPRNAQKKLAKSCFLYDETAVCYRCPQGKILRYDETKNAGAKEARRPCAAIAAGNARTARWPRHAWTRKTGAAEPSAATARNPCGRRWRRN